jgi:hypothetical protein
MTAIMLAISFGLNLAITGRWLVARSSRCRPRARIYEVILALYLVRRRLHVSEFRIEVRREAADIRRQLRTELDDLRRREGAS